MGMRKSKPIDLCNIEVGESLLRESPSLEVITLLLEAGEDPHARDNSSSTILMRALVQDSDLDIVSLLLDFGAEVNAIVDSYTYSRWKPLMFAAKHSTRPEMIKILIGAGADVNLGSRYNTPLLLVAKNSNNLEMFSILLDAGAIVDAKDTSGMSALMLAIKNNAKVEVISKLLDAGASVNLREYDWGIYPLGFVARYNTDPAVFSALIAPGADVNRGTGFGYTVSTSTSLMNSAKYSSDPLIFLVLIGARADVNVSEDEGMTPLAYATQNSNDPYILQMLIEAGAKVNIREKGKGMPPLLLAAKQSTNPEVLEVLLNAGADMNADDNYGSTAYTYAKNNPALFRTDVYWKLNDAVIRE